ncbi:MAG: hypothetical protein ACK5Q5_09720 [Planctomycetaceae bacterium]
MATHALRLWGRESTFEDGPVVPDFLPHARWRFSSPTLIAFLLDEDVYDSFYPGAQGLLARSAAGIAVRQGPRNSSDIPVTSWPDCEAHVDKVLSVLGEIGISSTHPVVVEHKAGTVEDLVADSLSRFVRGQEVEFSLKAYLHYLDVPAEWKNRYGDECSIGPLVVEVAVRPPGSGACLGIHVLHAAALALRVDDQKPFLGEDRPLVEEALRTAAAMLERSQTSQGDWPANWTGDLADDGLIVTDGSVMGSIRSTGHHLEWIALAPEELVPSDESIGRAIDYLVSAMTTLPGENYYTHFAPLSHAARALVLLHGKDIQNVVGDR